MLRNSKKMIPFFFKDVFKSKERFYLLLAGSGMGKTTFLINLYWKYVTRLFKKEYKMKLLPLAYPDIDKELDNIPDEEKADTILLLDAFDEDNKAVKDYRLRMGEICQKTWRFRKVIITCRTQFFPTEDDISKDIDLQEFGVNKGFHKIQKMYISPFNDKDIIKYLNKQYL